MKIYSLLGCAFVLMGMTASEIEPTKAVVIDLEDAPTPAPSLPTEGDITTGSKNPYKNQKPLKKR